MRKSSTNPLWLTRSLWLHRGLLWQLTLRDFHARFKGTVFGVLWALVNPVVQLVTYSFVFVVVFRIRWGHTGGNESFVIMLFAGLLMHSLMTECMVRSPPQMVANSSFVKKVVFPLELLPLVPLFSAFAHCCVGVMLLIGAKLWSDGCIPATVVVVPVILATFALMLAGLSYFLCATGVYFRDLNHVMGQLSAILMFASPVLFPMEIVPPQFRMIIMLNPLSLIVEQLREAAVLGRMPDMGHLGVYFGVACMVFWLGFSWFQLTRKGFADVL